jgi:4-amino-4-deoxy-L-arabinose transferase-like glycosyltransferase
MKTAMTGIRVAWSTLLKRFVGAHAATQLLLLGSAAAALWQWLRLVLPRLRYSGEIEWMEGGSVAHVLRLLDGKPLYVEPSLDFVPFIYPPLYYWIAAPFASLSGAPLASLRAVSVVATLGTLGLLVLFFVRRRGDWVAGVASAGLFASTFPLSGSWFDVARVDALFLFFVVLALVLLLAFPGRSSAIGAGLAITAALLTKQSGSVSLAVLAAFALLDRSRRGLFFVATAALGTGLCTLVGHLVSDGWYTYYLFSVPRNHRLLEEWIPKFWTHDLWGKLTVPSVLTVFALLSAFGRETPQGDARPSPSGLLAQFGVPIAIIALVVPAWMSRFHSGMSSNVLMPAHLALALGVGAALNSARSSRALFGSFAIVVALAQLDLRYPVQEKLPGSERREQVEVARKALSDLPDTTWFIANQAYAPSIGSPGFAHSMALIDVLRDNDDEVARKLQAQGREALRARRFGAIVAPNRNWTTSWFWKELERNYRLERRFETPKTMTGWNVQSVGIWVPKTAPPGK